MVRARARACWVDRARAGSIARRPARGATDATVVVDTHTTYCLLAAPPAATPARQVQL